MIKFDYKLSALLLLILLSGCQSISPSSYQMLSEDDCRYVYVVDDFKESRAYKIFQQRFSDDKAKMNYLTNLIRYSDRKLLRNGAVLEGSQIAKGIDYKYQKHHAEAPTIDAFVKNIGSYSNKTGEKYFMFVDDHRICPTEYVLENEVRRLEASISS